MFDDLSRSKIIIVLRLCRDEMYRIMVLKLDRSRSSSPRSLSDWRRVT